MITILPIGEREAKDRILRGITDAQDNAEVLMMRDAGREIGYAAVDVRNSTVRILHLSLTGSPVPDEKDPKAVMAADGLLRAAASYGAFAGAYRVESRTDAFRTYFEALGFEHKPDGFLCNLSNFIKNCGN